MIYSYLLPANLLTLIALLLGLNHFSRGVHRWRLVPLFLLVIAQLLGLIAALLLSRNPLLVASLIAAIQVLSTACLIWTLIIPLADLSPVGRGLAWLGSGLVILLFILSLVPGWPVSFYFHNLIITLGGVGLLAMSRRPRFYLILPLLLSLANILSLLGLAGTGGFLLLLGYGFFILALHRESLEIQRAQQALSASAAPEASSLNQERQRLLEVNEIISAAPGLEQSLDHVVRSLAHITHTDQVVILVAKIGEMLQLYLAALYASEGRVGPEYPLGSTFFLPDCLPLQVAMAEQQQLLLPSSENNELAPLYRLWGEERTGPTLIQPLVMQGRSIGVLLLGNPLSQRAIRASDQRLCRSLAAQVAMMTEANRQYTHLKARTEAMPGSQEFDLPVSEAELIPEFQIPPLLSPKTPEINSPYASPASAPVPAGVATLNPPQTSRGPEALATQRFAPAARVAEVSDIEPKEGGPLSETLLASDYYLSILENVEEGVVVSGAKGRVKLVNKAAERLLGKSRRELLGQPIGTVYGEIDSSETIEKLATAFSRRNEPLPTFFENEEQAIQGRLIPWRNREGQWLGMIAVFRDVTPQVKADRARQNFVTGLSRVLRGPLTLIKGYTELITNGSIENYSAEQIQVQRIIHSSAERVVEVLDNAVQISTQNKGKRLPRFETVDVTKIITEAIQQITPLAQLRRLELIQEISPDLPLVVVDPKHLYRILENLLSNACRFTPPGGRVRLTAWLQEEREDRITRPYLWLSVADNGVGIPKIEHKRIFEPFYQLNNQTPDSESGMGMGLAVVKELVEIHSGRVWVESTPGEGSIFHVLLPLTQG